MYARYEFLVARSNQGRDQGIPISVLADDSNKAYAKANALSGLRSDDCNTWLVRIDEVEESNV
ncbi:hypothetical protein SEA_KEANEYLIN_86 [Arthrobacter phage KeaneyLin]|uniref:Uncharacterized protein n=2 Tax=Mudcatvirus TaxID=1982088 RepID=A0A0U4JG02_9CAUD|nr:hypothetical protein FDH65_gp89 [Arthrobacter phage Circum]YP_010666964.1 hypothetical protein PQB83_gp86 [Arthrobacter phage KeaneyLin]ALY08772.1 hypothetical protein CIRCUM_89 [Arthrobacter phage Circum]AXH44224.1 hypothetical protein SEA_KEANEYLIN_86 [Arthrobacter phage KeaneyLin]